MHRQVYLNAFESSGSDWSVWLYLMFNSSQVVCRLSVQLTEFRAVLADTKPPKTCPNWRSKLKSFQRSWKCCSGSQKLVSVAHYSLFCFVLHMSLHCHPTQQANSYKIEDFVSKHIITRRHRHKTHWTFATGTSLWSQLTILVFTLRQFNIVGNMGCGY